MADANRTTLHPSLPANYVSFLDLRDRWMKQQQLKNRERNERDELQPQTIEVQADVERVEAVVDEDKGFVDDHQLENESPPQRAEESVVHSNPNPKNATRRPFHGHRRPTEKGNRHRWVQVSQTESPPVLPLNQPNQASKVQASQSEPAPVVQVDLMKALPVLHADQSKPPPSEAPKVDHAVQVPTENHSSDKEVSDRRLGRGKMKKAQRRKRNKKRNQEEDLVQSQPENGVLAPNGDLEERANLKVQLEPKALPVLHADQSKPQPLKAPKVVRSVQPRDEIHGSGEVVNDPNLDRAKTEKTKKKRKNKRRNQKVEDVIQSQPKKDILSPNVDLDEKENSKQKVEAVRENKDAADNSKAEIEGKFAGLSLSIAPEESSSRRSVAARNSRGWRKDGSFAKFEHRVMLKQERAKTETGLVWVKKGEASQIGPVPVVKACNMRV